MYHLQIPNHNKKPNKTRNHNPNPNNKKNTKQI